MAIKQAYFKTDLVNKIEGFQVPIGSVHPHTSTTPPSGFLICDGSSLLRSAYPNLFSVIGDAFGAADANHFNLPDLRGRFIRGYSGSTTRDPDRLTRTAQCPGGNTGNAIGSVQSYSDKSHNHTNNHNHGNHTTDTDTHSHFWVNPDSGNNNDGAVSSTIPVSSEDCFDTDNGLQDEYRLTTDTEAPSVGQTDTDTHTHAWNASFLCNCSTTGNAGASENVPVNIYKSFIIKI